MRALSFTCHSFWETSSVVPSVARLRWWDPQSFGAEGMCATWGPHRVSAPGWAPVLDLRRHGHPGTVAVIKAWAIPPGTEEPQFQPE